ncbi:MAG: Hpt domain-containing protein [Bacteroidales bacterium]|nr:Hpt domain-containing protein [Bacteroidales bacterium]
MEDQLEIIKKTFISNSMDELLGLKNKFVGVEISNPDPVAEELANDVFMVMHGISGTAPMVGLDNLAPLSRKLEIVFDKIRKGEKEFSEQIKIQTVRGIDAIIDELRF